MSGAGPLLAALAGYVLAGAALRPFEAGVRRERRFVADASHELRTPLSLLTTELELAQRRARSPEELRAALASAAESTAQLSRLADSLLLLAGADDGRLPLKAEELDVADLARCVAERHGVHVVAEPLVVRAVDAADNAAASQPVTVRVDRTAPAAPVV